MIVALVLFFGSVLAVISPDNSCGGSNGYTCKTGSCCSQYGWCGTTSSYCSTGCQPAFGQCGTLPTTSAPPTPTSTTFPFSPDDTCGSEAGFACLNACCSQHNWCGTTSDHCGTGCQAAFGQCGTIIPVTTTVTSSPPSTTTYPPSPDNTCGKAVGYSCVNSCCSKNGWCGSSSDYCGTGCQSAFGQCGTIVPTEPPEPTILPLPITKNGDCGPEVRKRCPLSGNTCCSDFGVCGIGVESCGIVRWACRPEYGTCGGPVPKPPLNSYPPIVSSKKTSMITKCTRPGVFALTYDDGVYDYTDQLLNVLATNNVKATFFINAFGTGDISQGAHKAALLKMFNAGHHIASHTYDHLDLTTLGYNGIYAQMQRNDVAIKAVIGVRPIYMRPPFGAVSDLVLTALGSWDYKVIWQNIDSEDVFHDGKPNAISLDTASYNSFGFSTSNPATQSYISLQHDRIIETVTQWTQTAINMIKSKGYSLVTVGDCLGEPSSSQWYRT